MSGIETATLRGTISALDADVAPGAMDDQSRKFVSLLETAAADDGPVFLPSGTYVLSNITLPSRVRLVGVPGATRIVYGGNGHLFIAENAEHIELTGITLDGANRWIGEQAQGLCDFRRVAHLVIDNCRIIGSSRNGLALEAVSGRIERSAISGAAASGIYSVEAGRLSITGNSVTDCANGGILVHRWQAADDFTTVTGNRVERIGARDGGTGQNGNGINAFRADKVIISSNSISDCAFSAVRANSCGDVQITGNTCIRSGETAVYSEFSFEGAVISGNVIDGAANGICVANFNEGGRMAVVSGNVVRNLSREGPYPNGHDGFGAGIGVEADTTVTGNVIEGAPLAGIQIGWGPYMRNVTATGNVIRKSRVGVMVSVVEGAGSTIISDNVIDAAEAGAIVGYRWAEASTGDLTEEPNGFGNLVIDRNHVS